MYFGNALLWWWRHTAAGKGAWQWVHCGMACSTSGSGTECSSNPPDATADEGKSNAIAMYVV
jgi:hypothetical protein